MVIFLYNLDIFVRKQHSCLADRVFNLDPSNHYKEIMVYCLSDCFYTSTYGYLGFEIQSTLVISNSKGLSEILRDIRSSTYQVCRIEEKII